MKKHTILIGMSLITLFVLSAVSPAVHSGSRQKKKNTKKNTQHQKVLSSSRSAKKVLTTSKKQQVIKQASKQLSGDGKSSVVKIVAQSDIRSGVRYTHMIIRGAEKKHHSVHMMTIDKSVSGNAIVIMKGKDRYNQLERLADMVPRVDSVEQSSEILGAVNANFWRAYLNNPIGPTVINGHVVELPSYKLWSSIFFDKHDKPTIDRFILTGTVRYPPQRVFAISAVNNRQSLPGVVLYNHFYGHTVPMNVFPSAEEIEHELMANRPTDDDSTEHIIQRADIEKMLYERKQSASIEYGLPKAQVILLDSPAVNKEVRAVVVQLRGDSISIPTFGAVISFGSDIPPEKIPARGDTVTIGFFTNIHRETPLYNSVSGTPRLVRNGIAQHEALIEGSKSSRFIKQGLPRTAIGYSADGMRLFLVSVEAKNSALKTHGATLNDMAILMQTIGAYQAMNLDGGGSAAMIIRQFQNIQQTADQQQVASRDTTENRENPQQIIVKNVVRVGSGVSQRRIAVGIGVRVPAR